MEAVILCAAGFVICLLMAGHDHAINNPQKPPEQ
jgi:hypothetical protein